MAIKETKMKTSLKILLAFFYFYAFMMHAFYDCNLRAYLMSADMEPIVDTAQDVYEQGRRFYIQVEFPEKELYESLNPEIYYYEKAIVAETYEKKYFWSLANTNEQALLVYSYEFEKV